MTLVHGGDKMEIVNVLRLSQETVTISSPIAISFKIIGAEIPFQFPFENNSLTDKKIIFIKNKE